MVLLGDNVYADTRDPEEMRQAYRKLAAKPGFAALREETRLRATWDDHDYGANDAGADFPAKRMAQRAFLEFFRVPPDDPRRKRPGIYRAETFGPPGRRVQLIMLDTRFYRDPEPAQGEQHPSGKDAGPTLLGKRQWAWLEKVLTRPAALRLLASSTQVLPHPPGEEDWGDFPQERKRLFQLLKRAGKTVILSGDRHFGEILKLAPGRSDGIGYPLYEITASGLNSAASEWHSVNPYRLEGPYGKDHFGMLRIDWSHRELVLQIRSAASGEVVRRQQLGLERLNP